MKGIFRIILFVVCITCNVSTAQDSQKAKAMLDDVSGRIKSYSNITIDFKYQVNNPGKNINQESKGNVVLQGDKYVLNFMGVTRIFDGKKVYNIVPQDEEITISAYDDKYAMDILQPIKGRKIQYIKLTPTDAKSDVKNVLLGIDSQTKHIYTLIQTDDNGTKTTITINSFKTNQPLSKNHFTFTESKYSNYYINRLD